MLDNPNHPPLDQTMPPASTRYTVDRRHPAAVMVWISGAMCAGLFGLCSLLLVALVTWQPAEVMSQLPADQVEQILMGLPIMSACMVVFVVLPGLALVVLGFGVRAGRRGQTVAAIVILWALIGLLGAIVLLSAAGGLMSGDILGILVNLVVFGSVVALLVATVLQVHRIGPGKPRDFGDEPWNSHLT